MERTLREIGTISLLENLVGKRFSFYDLRTYLKINCKGYLIELEKKSMEDVDIDIDFNLIGTIENKSEDFLCDFDIYYAKTRNGDMYITEVGYEFE